MKKLLLILTKNTTMKRLLLILLCLPLLFNSCQEDDPTPSAAPPSSSSVCGNVIITVNGTTLSSYSPIMLPSQLGGGCPLGLGVYYVNTNPYTSPYNAGVSLVSDPTGGLSAPEWSIAGEILNWTGGIINPTTSYDPNLPERDVICTFSTSNPAENYVNYDMNDPNGMQNKNGSMTISSIDLTTNLMSGEFEFTGYLLSPGTIPTPTKQIHCSFSDIPFDPKP
tara:strand:- start:1582 stop:2250 length:669 start_codon:yes stop_codon:yes gene_type:complete